MGARGVNIVNSSDALVANGVNIYDSSALSNASTNGTTVGQANTVTQKRLNARGALSCSTATVLSRILPVGSSVTGAVGTPIDLAALHINCATPNGNVVVAVEPGGQQVTLTDDGLGADRVAGDGIYSGRWSPTGASLAPPGQ